MRRALAEALLPNLLAALLAEKVRTPLAPGTLTAQCLFTATHRQESPRPRITVAVCTRDRPQDLVRCLEALQTLDYPDFEVLVVDNAATSTATRDLLRTRFPVFRYVEEHRPGLNWARNRALQETSTDLIAFTDDDVVPDASWLLRIAEVFEDQEVAAVTGLIAPFELQTDSQLHFEAIGGFGRGFRKAWHRIDPSGAHPDVYHLGAGRFGAGANMSFRTHVLREIGGFDPALDVGTSTEGGGDLDAFLRILHEGRTLVYEPAAITWHVHRRDASALRSQIATWGTALGALMTATFVRYPDFRPSILRFALVWSWMGYITPLLRNALGPGRTPRRLRGAPLLRLSKGPFRYFQARRTARSLGADCIAPVRQAYRQSRGRISIALVDLSRPLEPLTLADEVFACLLHVTLGDRFVGSLRIENRGRSISPQEIAARVSQDLAEPVLQLVMTSSEVARATNLADLVLSQMPGDDDLAGDEFSPRLASVVIATRNRPAQLRRCLESLAQQSAPFPFEVVVVDNDPASGAARSVVDDFACVRYVTEVVPGLSAARNTGFRAARGEILVATDDDVVTPPGWLQQIVQPFRFEHIGVATGLVAPLSLDTESQRHFEAIGGLGKGHRSFEVGLDWLAGRPILPPRAWDLGATANAAFRRAMLEDPRVGLLPESLGPGSPAGGGEDAYIFYRAINVGYGVFYEPDAMLLHEHRSDPHGLRRQMVDYARGHVAYLLTTLVQDGDLRALSRLLAVLPAWHLWRLLWPFHRLGYPRQLVLAELEGYLSGCWGWWSGRRRERRLTRGGRTRSSEPLMPLEEAKLGALSEGGEHAAF
jgi:glycosyltransferase involved in cell wall biosynthesis